MEAKPTYGYTTKLARMRLPDARGRVEEALKKQGFGVLTEIDVEATLEKKLGAEFRPYLILGACNPHLAKRALEVDLDVGLLLPCNVTLWAEGEDTVVSIADPQAMFQIARNPALAPVVDEATKRLRAVAEDLSRA